MPTFAELGIPDMNANFWWGFVGPAGMPKPIADKLNVEIGAVLSDPALKATFRNWQIAQSPGAAEAFGTYIPQEYERWKAIVAKSGLPLE